MARELRQDKAFDEQFTALVPDVAVRAVILDGLRATICEDPTVGVPFDDPPFIMWYFFVPEAPAWGNPAMTGCYSFTESGYVDLHWIDLDEDD